MADDGSNLRGVFDLCNPDGNGYILTEYLADKLSEQFSDQSSLITIQNALDPERKGRISFDEFCDAVNTLQDTSVVRHPAKPGFYREDDDGDSSDPENTYNEYDIPEDDSIAGEMENFEAVGESPHNLSPIKMHESNSEQFKRHGSFRRSHRRAHSWNMRAQNGSLSFEPQCEGETSSVSSEIDDLHDKVDSLQDHLSRLAEEKTLQSQYEAVKRENQQLSHQVNELEEKVQDMADRSEELQRDSRHKLDDLNREHDLQIQILQSRIEMLAADKERLESELVTTKNSARERRESLVSFQNKTEDLTKQIIEINEEYRRLNQRFAQQEDKHEEQESRLRDEINLLRHQLEAIQLEKGDLETMVALSKNDPLPAKLKAHMDSLKAENDELKSKNEELSGQLAQNLSDVRTLMCGDGQSIAQELSHASKDEVMEALRKQEDVNDQLRDYLDKIILNILEKDPGMLEIK
ncbi:uncharacterized protein LOC143468734 [Clavelina lepadiformis]|uniref:uncharacterized protein LOC143468734 n=1 Tax=Clavelina lepadiformis TaxID=159417 RepID=UPI0040414C0D